MRKYAGSAAATSAIKRRGLSGISIRSRVRSTPAWLVCAMASFRMSHHAGRIPVVIVDQDENKNGNTEADEQQRHDQAQSWSSHRGEQRRRRANNGSCGEAATAIRANQASAAIAPTTSNAVEAATVPIEPPAAIIFVPDQYFGQRLVGIRPRLRSVAAMRRQRAGSCSPIRSASSHQCLRVLSLEQQGLAALFLE